MITKQTIKEKFDEKFSKNSGGIINFIDPMSEDMNVTSRKIKSFYDSQIQSLLEQIIPEKANERNTGKISQTEILSYEQSSGWNLCLEELKSRIINSGFEVK